MDADSFIAGIRASNKPLPEAVYSGFTGISPMGDHFYFAVGIRNLLNSRQPERIDSDNSRPEIHSEGRSMYLKLKGTL